MDTLWTLVQPMRRNIRRLGRASLSVAALTVILASTATHTPANADGYIPGAVWTDSQYVTDWSGFYVGGKFGGTWGDIGWAQHYTEFVLPGAAGQEASFSPGGVAGGIMGGANLQMGYWIFGLEIGFVGTGLSQSTASPSFPATDTFKTDIDWLLSIEPRLGYTFDRTMVFIKGGWVGGNASLSVAGVGTGGAYKTFKTDEFVDGWSLGAGVEYAWWPSFIVGLEYQYVHLNLSTAGSCDLCLIGIPIGTEAAITGGADISSVMLRASYLFRPEDGF